jgi:hypothetical protein
MEKLWRRPCDSIQSLLSYPVIGIKNPCQTFSVSVYKPDVLLNELRSAESEFYEDI